MLTPRKSILYLSVEGATAFGTGWSQAEARPLPTLPTVLDVNDETPTFSPAVYNVSVSEDVPRDFRVVWLNCTDNDVGLNAELSYFITGVARRGWGRRGGKGPTSALRTQPLESLRICSWLFPGAL